MQGSGGLGFRAFVCVRFWACGGARFAIGSWVYGVQVPVFVWDVSSKGFGSLWPYIASLWCGYDAVLAQAFGGLS